MNESIDYRHSKTGNIYEYLADVKPAKEVPQYYTMHMRGVCSETSQEVALYYLDEQWYYMEDSKLPENGALHVMYTRDKVVWLRPYEMFHELVTIEGEQRPRFERVE